MDTQYSVALVFSGNNLSHDSLMFYMMEPPTTFINTRATIERYACTGSECTSIIQAFVNTLFPIMNKIKECGVEKIVFEVRLSAPSIATLPDTLLGRMFLIGASLTFHPES